ncbi:DNA internalization-related competence protein ComEC/Rec2 [Neobacillus notoginsengisoli]|uniref:DNA internalization-related competence protein ComEC/Rec2 n=1 Tax=Neobacillus notoginsengisoli TaxID=1578198 RepID=A0A417YUK6_9BACI|nr:DNA internalization-related competence protein ComEC/Rec2 [Neobacillus notoginsengisoli]RHW40986.1 DNA internalization-related competence protein ComEC/Rec2 [Neobacillus notoginsengisoli]
MKGKLILLAPPALLGTMLPLHGPHTIIALFFPYLVLLSKYKKFSFKQILFVCALFLVFALTGKHSVENNKTSFFGNERNFSLVFNEGAAIDGDRFKAIAKDLRTGEKIAVTYKVASEHEKENLQKANFFGRLCGVNGSMKQPASAKNPGGFDYNLYLKEHQIHWILTLDTAPLGNCSVRNASMVEKLRMIRQEGISHITAQYPSESASLVSALIFGEQTLISEDVMAAYKKIGITHLLAISGMQVTVLAGLVFLLGVRLGVTRERMSILLLAVLPAYAVIAGASPSVIRSVLMAGILLLTAFRSSFISPAGALSLSFMAFILIDPYSLYDPGFQLSYLVTFSLLFSSGALRNKNYVGLEMLAVTALISQLAALPILLLHFFELPLISIAANIIFIPIYSFILMPAVYLLYPFSFVKGLAGFAGGVLNGAVMLSDRLALFLAKIPLQMNPGKQTVAILVFYTASVFYSFIAWERAKTQKVAYLALMLPFLLLMIQEAGELVSNRAGEVTVIDVGQGDSIFISLPNGNGNYLIDTGGSVDFAKKEWQRLRKPYDPGRDTVIPFLKAKGIVKLNKLILTHGDEDHIGGAAAIMENIKIDEILLPAYKEKSEGEEEIINLADRIGINIKEVARGDVWKAGNSTFYVLSPIRDYTGDRNGGSIVIYSEFSGNGWLFTGDLPEDAEKELVRLYPAMKVDVLKAGHHGSKTSSSAYFLKHYKPAVALISAGENNRFGHPHKETVERLDEARAKIYRTDLHGAITYSFKGKSGTFSTFLPYTGALNEKKKAK